MGDLIHDQSSPLMKSEIDLFTVPATQTIYDEGMWTTHFPISSLDRNGPLEFHIVSSSDVFIDPANIYLETKCKIVGENNEPLNFERVTSDDDDTMVDNLPEIVTPINYFGATQFKDLEVSLNNKVISTSDNMYAYRAFIETLLTYSFNTKKTQLQMGFYYDDNYPGKDDNVVLANVQFEDHKISNGNKIRWIKTRNSLPFQTYTKIHGDIFSQDRLLIGGTELRIKFTRADPKFALISPSDDCKAKVSIEKAVLYVREQKVAPHVLLEYNKALLESTAKYPQKRVEMKYFTRSRDLSDLSENSVCSGVLPRRIIFCMVNGESFNGKFRSCPFKFQPCNIQRAVLRVNGNATPYSSIEFEPWAYNQGYASLMNSLGILGENQEVGISLNAYASNKFFLGFNLSSDMDIGNIFQPIKEGTVSLELKLSKSQDFSIVLIAYIEYDALLQIDAHGTVHQQ